MPNVFSKNDNDNNLNLNPIVYLHNVDHFTDYRLFDLGNGEKIKVSKYTSKRCKEFFPRFAPFNRVYSFSLDHYFECINKRFQKWSIASPRMSYT